jgi:hypothetical protein
VRDKPVELTRHQRVRFDAPVCGSGPVAQCARQAAGDTPTTFLKVRLNAASDAGRSATVACDVHRGGIADAHVATHRGTLRFASIASLASTERACVWTLGGMLDDAQFERLLSESDRVLRPFVTADGTIEFEMPALVVTAVRA